MSEEIYTNHYFGMGGDAEWQVHNQWKDIVQVLTQGGAGEWGFWAGSKCYWGMFRK